jgi:purine-binding chemotaxis protein CheW
MGKGSNNLVDQSQALDSFFESLMRDVEAYEENEKQQQSKSQDELSQQEINPLPSIADDKGQKKRVDDDHRAAPEPAVNPAMTLSEQIPDHQTREKVDTRIFESLPPVAPSTGIKERVPVSEQTVVEPDKISPLENEVLVEKAKLEAKAETESREVPAGKPEWAESEFQVMLFKVAGLTLAVPLVELNGVVECDLSSVTEMPGHADFYLGLMHHLERTVPLVDTARFVLPPDKLKLLAGDDPKERISRVVMIQDCQYGLACDEVNEVITLSPDSVRWRTQRTQRRWLAGTVVDHMCALIDANAFADLLASRAPIQDFRE